MRLIDNIDLRNDDCAFALINKSLEQGVIKFIEEEPFNNTKVKKQEEISDPSE